MPRRADTASSSDNTQGAQHGRGRGRTRTRARGTSAAIHIHANGSAEISFQTEVSNPQAHHPHPSLPTVAEVPTPGGTLRENFSIPTTTPDSPTNPFVSADGLPPNEDFLHHPNPPASPSEESFPDASPSRSISGSPPPRTRGSPRAGRHSTVTCSPSRSSAVGTSGPTRTARNTKKGAPDVRTFFKTENNKQFCVFCKHQHSVNSNHEAFGFSLETGTSSLRAHLIKHHIEQWVDGCDKFNIAITAETVQSAVASYRARKGQASHSESSGERPPDICAYSYDAFVDAITQFIIADDQSLNVIESPHLRRIFMLLREGLKDSDIPHRTAIRNHVKEIYDEHLAGLEGEIKAALGKISLTSDLWTDKNLSPFMAITAHWIETKVKETPEGLQYELKLRAELIGFHRVPGHHDGEHLCQAFLYILDRLSITFKIGWVTLDNASNNDTFMASLECELRARDIPFDRVENRIRCFPHVVNLACKVVIAALAQSEPDSATGEHRDPIGTLRALIRAIRVSSLRRQHFSEVSAKFDLDLQLLRDVDTRWSSTLYMIERALHLEKPIDAICSSREFRDLEQYRLSSTEWDALAVAREILIVPDAFQQKLSAEKTPTLCNALPSFDGLVSVWKALQDNWGERVSEIIQKGIDKLDTYHDRAILVPAYTISMLLNPSMKLGYIPTSEHGEAKALLYETLLPYYEKRTAAAPSRPAAPVQIAPPEQTLRATDYTPRRSRMIRGRSIRGSVAHRTADQILGLSRRHVPGNSSLEDEINRYLNDSSTGTSNLTFWQENQLRYPTLFIAALDYLAIQGSAVPCERVFSSAKETMTDRRNRIHEDLMEMLQMLKFPMKSGKSLDFTSGTSREDVLAFIQSTQDAENAVPEDINSYIQSLLSTVE